MLTINKCSKPEWVWLPPVCPTEIYTWALFRLEEERFWQIAWSEYVAHRTLVQSKYKSDNNSRPWRELGTQLYQSMLDPQLFIELVFENYMRNERPRPPEVSELMPKLETLGLWYDESYLPNAESRLFLSGEELNNLVARYPDTTVEYWMGKDPKKYEPYMHLLFTSSGVLDPVIASKGLKQLHSLQVLRALEVYSIWPEDAQEKLMAARRHQKQAKHTKKQ